MAITIRRKCIILLIFIISISFHLFGATIIYDRNGANITGFDISGTDNSNPSTYNNSNDYTGLAGYAGRLLYRGEGTTLIFENGGPIASSTSNNRFYFTKNGDTNGWKEVFFITRVKGKRHNSSTIVNYYNINTIIEHPSDSISLPSAGPELLTENGPGFDQYGNAGTYNGSNQYIYTYKYDYTIVEITIIRTSTTRNFSSYFTNYETIVSVTGEGVDINLSFIGQTFWSSWLGSMPEQYVFSVERVVDDLIPIEVLSNKNSINDALNVGFLKYHSYFNDSGTISFSSNSSTVNTTFLFTRTIGSNIYSFPYNVVFDATKPNLPATKISSSNNSFASSSQSVVSPIGGSTVSIQALEGDIKIYLDSPSSINGKPPGDYSSTIYCLLSVN